MKLLDKLTGSKTNEADSFDAIYKMNEEEKLEYFKDLTRKKVKHVELSTRNTMTIMEARHIDLNYDEGDNLVLLEIYSKSATSSIEIKGIESISYKKPYLVIIMYDSFLDV